MSEDIEALEKQLENKQFVISDLKAIHVVQGEVIKDTKKENHEMKEDRDVLKKELNLVKREIHDLKRIKKKSKSMCVHERSSRIVDHCLVMPPSLPMVFLVHSYVRAVRMLPLGQD